MITAAQWKEILPGWEDPNAKGFITALFTLHGSQMCTKVVPSDENIRAITSFVQPNYGCSEGHGATWGHSEPAPTSAL